MCDILWGEIVVPRFTFPRPYGWGLNQTAVCPNLICACAFCSGGNAGTSLMKTQAPGFWLVAWNGNAITSVTTKSG